jgi:peptide chain release factor 1
MSFVVMWDKLENSERRYEELNYLIAQPEVIADYERWQSLVQEQTAIQQVVLKFKEYKKILRELEQTQSMLNDSLESEMVALVKQEVEALEIQCTKLERSLKLALSPQDPNDERDIIMEIRAGTGGEEAALFAADLFRMYTRYAQAKGSGLEIEVIDSSESGRGGFREIVFEVRGKRAFSRLKYERGVHRVQRVPITEASGRIHTSTATVAALPEAEEVEVNINPEDLKVDFFHSGGPGGQNVNKVTTAVRIVHLPTGVTATCQDERSQLRNRMKAMAVLRARLLDREQHWQQEERTSERRSQVGSGERAEKIRTYNFPQNRVTDHRINLTLYNLSSILEGELDELIDALAASERVKQLEQQSMGVI